MNMLKLVTKNIGIENSHTLAVAKANGGYSRVEKALALAPEAIVEDVIKSNLRGLGGAGFPAGRKWSFLPKDSPKPRYLVVNGDEGEPGTVKDKYIMIYDPHLLIEGIIITCFAIRSHKAFIYIRGEYDLPIARVEGAIAEAKAAGILGDRVLGHDFALDIVVHRGAGAYICGEETSLLESLEGKRGWPRLKPPFPAVEGYQRCPTVVNNIETLSYVPFVIEMGGQAFADLGSERNGGLRIYSVSGRVNKPGVYELPMGTPLRQIIYEHAGGISGGRQLKAVIPGGSSAPILTAAEIDVPMDFDSLAKIGSMLGSAGIVVFDESVSIPAALLVLARFYAHESCGQCTPCREGTAWMTKIIQRILDGDGRMGDADNLIRIAKNVLGNTICPLGDAAALPVISWVTKFRPEFEEWIKRGRPVGQAPIPVTHIGERTAVAV
ncbi:MAG: NADH-quinone oxidoreductase subunit NuoF [candidate division Zixibacteria bacterium]|nr:NADH-quinone oxidoreductase subunit NuoF [candidate division Zixibacteria bacterium]